MIISLWLYRKLTGLRKASLRINKFLAALFALLILSLPSPSNANECKIVSNEQVAFIELDQAPFDVSKLCNRSFSDCMNINFSATSSSIRHAFSSDAYPLRFLSFRVKVDSGTTSLEAVHSCETEAKEPSWIRTFELSFAGAIAFVGVLLTLFSQWLVRVMHRRREKKRLLSKWKQEFLLIISEFENVRSANCTPPSHAEFSYLLKKGQLKTLNEISRATQNIGLRYENRSQVSEKLKNLLEKI